MLVLILSGILATKTQGQRYVDLFRVYGNQGPMARFPGDDKQEDLNEAGFETTLPIPLGDRIALITGLSAERQSFFADSSLAFRTEIYSLGIKAGAVCTINDSWSITGLALPKMAGDISGNSDDDFQLGFMALAKKTKHDRLSYSFGLYANNDRFGPFLVPLIGMYYLSPRKDFEINATLPVWADIRQRVGYNVWCGLSFSAVVRSYYLNDEVYQGEELYLERRSNDVLAYVQFDLSESLLIQTKLGYSIGRATELYDADDQVNLGLSLFRFGDERSLLNTDMNDGPMIQLRLVYRYHLP